jgi:phage tail sheath protein FI
VAAFVGQSPQGPTTPTLITGWQQYVARFGGFAGPQYLLPFAVYQFFLNGGKNCYVVRAVNGNASTASVQLTDISSTQSPKAGLKVSAIAPGAWGSNINVAITVGASADRFDLIVRYNSTTTLVERFPDVSNDPADPRYVASVVNSPVTGSNYVQVTDLKVGTAGWTYNEAVDGLAAVDPAELAGGADGSGTPDLIGATNTLDQVPGVLNINLPGVSSQTVLNGVIAYCEARGTAFLVVDGAQAPANSTSAQVAANYVAMISGGNALTPTSYAAIYGPWLIVADPSSSLPGAMRFLPPGGAVLGQMAATDALRGVQKAPAGIDSALVGVLDLETRFTSSDTDLLNSKAINAIRIVPGSGFCIMGARTLKTGYPDRYVPVRRTLQMLRNDLSNLTRFAIFESNGPSLWNQINAVCTQYLTTLMQTGVLSGNSPDTAFFVQCDANNNPPSQTGAGIVNITIGVALQSPAEFVIVTISQYEGGTSATDNAT